MKPNDESEIMQIIMYLKNSHSKGHDNLSVNAVKNCSNEFARPLTLIFNQSISDGVVPDDLKIA